MTLKTRVGLLGVLLVGAAAYAIAEDLTVTTTYPSPRGVYKQLRVGSGTFAAPTASLHVVKPDDDGTFALRVDDQDSDTSPFVIDQNGKVGIGTTTPAFPAKLHVVGGEIHDEGTTAAFNVRSTAVGGRPYALASGPYGAVLLGVAACPAGKFCIADPALFGAALMTFNPLTAGPTQGNVGIGTNNPQARLHVRAVQPDQQVMLAENINGSAGISLKATSGGGQQYSLISVSSLGGPIVNCGTGNLCIYNSALGLGVFNINGQRVGIGNGMTVPGSLLGVSNNVSIGSTYASQVAPANSLIVEGNVGIGTATPTVSLYVNGEAQITGGLSVLGSTLNVIDGTLNVNSSTTLAGHLQVNGNVDVTGIVHALSDARLKTTITPLTGALDKLDQLHGISFDWNELHQPTEAVPTRQIGLIAQDVEAVYPELVASVGVEGYKAVDYMRLTAVLVEAIKELKRNNEALTKQIDALERRLDREATRSGSGGQNTPLDKSGTGQ